MAPPAFVHEYVSICASALNLERSIVPVILIESVRSPSIKSVHVAPWSWYGFAGMEASTVTTLPPLRLSTGNAMYVGVGVGRCVGAAVGLLVGPFAMISTSSELDSDDSGMFP